MLKKSIWFIISLLIVDLLVLVNFPVLGPLYSFSFFAFIPGLLILEILKVKLNFFYQITLSLAISVAFLMLFGFFVNFLSISIGIKKPFSTINLLIATNLILLVFILLVNRINDNEFDLKAQILKIKNLELLNIVPILFPILAVCATLVMNYTNNNIFSMILIVLISLYVCILMFKDKINQHNYPFSLLMISMSLILIFAMRSNHILGTDVNLEYYYYQSVVKNLLWGLPTGNKSYLACLSISILPTVFDSLVGVKGELMYKLVFPIIFSFLPLVVYFFSRKFFSNRLAFLAGLFFVSSTAFFGLNEVLRQGIALLFFGMAILIIFDESFPEVQKKILFLFLLFSMVVSHYSTAYIVLIIVGLIWLILLFKEIFLRLFLENKTKSTNTISFTKKMALNIFSMSIIILLMAFIFIWYAQMTDTAFTDISGFIKSTIRNLQLFLYQDLAPNQDTLIPTGDIRTFGDRIVFYIGTVVRFVMIMGIISLFVNYYLSRRFEFRGLFSIFRLFKFPENLRNKIFLVQEEYILLIFLSFVLVFLDLFISYIVSGRGSYPINRLYITVLFFLAPAFIFGFLTLSRFIRKNLRIVLLTSLILIQLFSSVGLVNYFSGDDNAIVFQTSGPTFEKVYIFDQEVTSGIWLKDKGKENMTIFVDYFSSPRLNSLAGISDNRFKLFKKTMPEGYYYLRSLNIKNNIFYKSFFDKMPRNETLPNLESINEIYDSGGSQVWVRI